MLKNKFYTVSNWSAWSDTLSNKESWLQWVNAQKESLKERNFFSASSRHLPVELPSVKFLPISMRKRLSPLCKLSLFLMNEVLSDSDREQVRVVMSSRHGESRTIVELLSAVGKQEPSSPMAFSRSVHNSAIGLWSIAAQSKVAHTAVSSMENSFYAGLTESLIQLFTQTESPVLYVYADDVVPKEFKKFLDHPNQAYGGAFLLKRAKRKENFSCSWPENLLAEENAISGLSKELSDFLNFITGPCVDSSSDCKRSPL